MLHIYRFIKEWGPSLLIAVVISLTLRIFIIEAVNVPTESMFPTMGVNDKFLLNKVINKEKLEFGDIVVFDPPVESEYNYVKRLIGKEGDTIEIKDGYLYINNERIEENYLAEEMRYEFGPVTVPENKYFFLGDNRNYSYDSHLWETTPFVDESAIVGKIVVRYYPFNKFKLYID